MHFGGPETDKKQSRKFNKIKGRQKFGFISPQVGEAGGRLIRNKNGPPAGIDDGRRAAGVCEALKARRYTSPGRSPGFAISKEWSAEGAIYPRLNPTGIERLCHRVDYRSRLQRSDNHNACNPGLPSPAGKRPPAGDPVALGWYSVALSALSSVVTYALWWPRD